VERCVGVGGPLAVSVDWSKQQPTATMATASTSPHHSIHGLPHTSSSETRLAPLGTVASLRSQPTRLAQRCGAGTTTDSSAPVAKSSTTSADAWFGHGVASGDAVQADGSANAPENVRAQTNVWGSTPARVA
jgi:hypothetical protein